MENKSDKYLELAKQVRLAHVPNKGKEAESLLNSTKSGTAQNIFTRIFNYFGRHLIMTITSLIALIVAGVLLNNPRQIDNEQATAEVLIEATEKNYAEEYSKAADFTYSENNEKIEDIKVYPDTIVTIKLIKPEDVEWKYVELNIDNWNFLYLTAIETKKYIYEDTTENHFSVNQIHTPLEEKYLIKVMKQLEEGLSGNIEFSDVKKLAYLEIDNYFERLSAMCEQMEKVENGAELAKMLNLYAHLTCKLYNDPAELMKIKNKGIYLPKETLESLGIQFTDSTISVPYDHYYTGTENIKQWFKWKRLPELTDETLIQEEKIIKWNYVYEWNQLAPFVDEDDKWVGTFAPHYRRQDARKNYEDSQHKIIKHTYFNDVSIENPDKFNPLCPIIDHHISNEVSLDALLYFNDNKSNRIFNNNVDIIEYWGNVANMRDTIPKEKFREYEEKYHTKNMISQNKLNAYKYKYLVPVEVQYPFYNLSKEELDSLDYYTSITLWYYPSEEFLSKLPEDIREQLEKEIQLVEDVQKGELQPEEACAEVGNEESLLGLCNLTDKAIANLKVYPNPATDMINISFELLDTRYYKIILTDLSGNYVQDLTVWTEENEGEIRYNHNLANMENGTYLVQVITEKSEKLLGKFILKK